MTAPVETASSYRAAEQAARASYGKLVAILAARNRDIAAAEDALSDALLAALRVWPKTGVPGNPDAWLLTAARNRQRNDHRAAQVRRAAEPDVARRLELPEPDEALVDSRLALMFVAAHPAIDPATRAPLILQTVLGISAARIARAFLVDAPAMSQRLVRAKSRIRDAGLRFGVPEPEDRSERLEAVLDAIYAAFGQGWDSLDAPENPDGLTGEAIWLARLLVATMPDEPEPKGLLALMLYCDARRLARRDAEGRFVPLDRQDARLWNRDHIIEAENLLTAASQSGRFGRYQCEAAIQSVHVQLPVTGRLNLTALRTLYDLLVSRSDSLGARIGRAVVIAEAGAPLEALAELDALPADRMQDHQPWWVARGRIAALAGRREEASTALRTAVSLTEDEAVRHYLLAVLGDANNVFDERG
jgi:RNA polymerase sigma-70 factor, ECF subfamily